MIDSLAGSFPVDTDQLRLVIYQQFGLPKDFKFDFVLFSGGNEDVFSMTSAHVDDPGAPGRRRISKYAHPARLTKEGRDVTAGDYYFLRKAYVEKLKTSFGCNLVDFGIGFPPPSEACVSWEDVTSDLEQLSQISADGSASALYRVVRIMCLKDLADWNGENDKVWPSNRKMVLPFGWPYFDVTSQWVVDERHYGRQAMHVGNALTWVYWTAYCMTGQFPREQLYAFRLCPGTPRLVVRLCLISLTCVMYYCLNFGLISSVFAFTFISR
jgi:hypothetical protein